LQLLAAQKINLLKRLQPLLLLKLLLLLLMQLPHLLLTPLPLQPLTLLHQLLLLTKLTQPGFEPLRTSP
jgi:hypothetical protein